jgi:hypothetical protein
MGKAKKAVPPHWATLIHYGNSPHRRGERGEISGKTSHHSATKTKKRHPNFTKPKRKKGKK